MIAKITSGSNFRGVLDYLLQQKKEVSKQAKTFTQEEREEQSREMNTDNPGERHRLIGGNMTGQTRGELADEFEAFREQRPDIKKPVHHLSLSAAKGERLSDKAWNQIARKYVERMNFTRSPYVVIQHVDTEHDHIHIVTSRIDIDGKVISDFQSKTRAEEFVRQIEREYGLTHVQSSHERERAAPKRGEIENFNRTGKLSVKMSLQGHIDYALKDNSTASEFIKKLEQVGIEVIPFWRTSDKVTGISFKLEGQLMKGSNLGSAYSWNGLQKRGMSYEQERDLLALRDITMRNAEKSKTKNIAAPLNQQAEIGLPSFTKEPTENRIRNDAHALIEITNQPHVQEVNTNKLDDSHNTKNQNIARTNEAERIHQAASIELIKDPIANIDWLNRITGLEHIEPLQEKSKTQEELTKHEELQTPKQTQEMNKEAKEKTINRSFDRIR